MQTKIYGNDDILKVLEIAMQEAIPALLVGQTGTGKNTIIRHIAGKHNRTDIIRLNLTGETTVDDLLGHYQIQNRSTVWQDGSVTQAARNGNIIVLDEVNAAQPEVLFALQSLLDDDRNLTLTSHDNSVVQAHKDFRVFATMNPTVGYSGTKDMNKAFMSRFGLVVNVDYIDADSEKALISGVFPSLDDKDLMVMLDTARKARKSLQDGKLLYPLSTRDVLSWAQMTLKLKDIVKAFDYTIGAKAGVEAKDIVEMLKESVEEVNHHADYVEQITNSIEESLKSLDKTVSARALIRQESDRLVETLENVRKIALEKERLTQDVTQEVKQSMADARKRLKASANKLNSQLIELETKRKEIYQEGYDAAQKEMFKKLGVA